jgi:hypothetical protein
MSDTRLDVTIYAGYRGAERPSSFVFEGIRIEVLEIVRTWVEEEYRTRAQKRFFIVHGSDQYVYTVYCDAGSGEWFFRGREKQRPEKND